MRRSLGIEEKLPARLEILRMRRRHLRSVMAIEREVYPRPWSANLFLSEMTDERTRTYLIARIDREIVGYAGLNCWGDEYLRAECEGATLILDRQAIVSLDYETDRRGTRGPEDG